MAEPSIYEQVAIAINGTLIVEATQIGITYADSDEVLPLLGLTINGAPRRGMIVSPGARYMVVEVSEGRRSVGATVAVDRLYLDATEITLTATLLGSGEAMTSSGFIKSPSIAVGYGRALVSSWSFVGYAAAFEGA